MECVKCPFRIGARVQIVAPQKQKVPGGWGMVHSMDIGFVKEHRSGPFMNMIVDFPNQKRYISHSDHFRIIDGDNEDYLYQLKELPSELQEHMFSIRI